MRKAAPAPGAPPAAAAAPRSSSSPAPAAPRFGQLLRAALESVGVRYASVDLLRKAKRDSISHRERCELWKLLYDVVMVVIADFDVDVDEMARLNSSPELDAALADPELHRIQAELVRFYMYEWGFLCGAFYDPQTDPSGQVLLLALAWLVAYSKLFERQHQAIVEQYLGTAHAQLPPFHNDVVLDDQSVVDAVDEATRELCEPPLDEKQARPSTFEDQIHHLHAAYGRLQHSVGELLAFHRCHQRLLLRLERLQGKPMTNNDADGGDKRVDADAPLPASILQLLAQPTTRLDAQLRAVACSLQVLDDEILFYKWINGVVASLSSSDSTGFATTSEPDAELEERKQTVDTLLRAEAYRQLTQSFQSEWLKWKKQVKSSRSRIEQMEAKFDASTQQIRRAELMHPQKLFLLNPRQHEAIGARRRGPRGRARSPESLDEELKRLETQLERVLGEITNEYCHLSLQ